jgi:hypothetical protein
MGNQAASRFGQDGPSRITVVPSMLTEASEVMPYEPVYQPVIPFYPPVISNGDGTSTGGGTSLALSTSASDDWKAYPDKLDLFWWQGDDVTVELIFPGEEDMSAWEWHADVRYWPSYQTHLYYEFVISAEFFPEDVELETPAHTTVTLFLPRQLNNKVFKGSWELHSISPYEGPTYTDSPPEGVDEEDWPPVTTLKTWTYGNITIVPRTNDTDVLPGDIVVNEPEVFVISHFGPNGRVP